ncbi:hypothetical protein F5Y09DRAFT_355740 [Xylaria sp. FL1042]|nr:hypothetical protein F5Y09DRAFT_355740 [Xylaria sp. FL1042]
MSVCNQPDQLHIESMTSKAATSPGRADHTCPDGSGGEAGINPQEERLIFNGKPISVEELQRNANMIEGKGEFLGGDSTGLVERLKSGDVIKSRWTDRPTASD